MVDDDILVDEWMVILSLGLRRGKKKGDLVTGSFLCSILLGASELTDIVCPRLQKHDHPKYAQKPSSLEVLASFSFI